MKAVTFLTSTGVAVSEIGTRSFGGPPIMAPSRKVQVEGLKREEMCRAVEGDMAFRSR